MDPYELLNPAKVAKMLDKSEGTLNQMRHNHSGPPYVIVGRRSVRYMRQDVIDYLLARRVDHADTPVAKVSA